RGTDPRRQRAARRPADRQAAGLAGLPQPDRRAGGRGTAADAAVPGAGRRAGGAGHRDGLIITGAGPAAGRAGQLTVRAACARRPSDPTAMILWAPAAADAPGTGSRFTA